MIEDTKSYNGHTYSSGNLLSACRDGYEQGKADAIEFIVNYIIFPLLDELDRGLWEDISYIELAEEWIKVLDDNPYPKVKNHTEARKRDLRQWIAEKLNEVEKMTDKEKELVELYRNVSDTMQVAIIEILKATQIDHTKEDDLK